MVFLIHPLGKNPELTIPSAGEAAGKQALSCTAGERESGHSHSGGGPTLCNKIVSTLFTAACRVISILKSNQVRGLIPEIQKQFIRFILKILFL